MFFSFGHECSCISNGVLEQRFERVVVISSVEETLEEFHSVLDSVPFICIEAEDPQYVSVDVRLEYARRVGGVRRDEQVKCHRLLIKRSLNLPLWGYSDCHIQKLD